jgi:hypothetical protein
MNHAFFCAVLLVGTPAIGQVFFDGLYEARDPGNPTECYYLRFFKDGSVQGVVSKPNSTEEVGQWFNYTKFNKEVGRGFYLITEKRIEITTSFVRKDADMRYVTVDFLRGEIAGTGESLKLLHTYHQHSQVQTTEQIFHFNNFSH